MSKVCICIPTYNGAAFLKETLQSILTQTYKDFELYISDDGSTDGTCQLVEQVSSTDARVHLVQNPGIHGLVGNWNHCLKLLRDSGAAYSLIVCQDDLIYPNYLEKKIPLFSDDDIVMVCCATDIINADSKKLLTRRIIREGTYSGNKLIKKSLYLGNIYGEGAPVLFRTSVIDKVGQFGGTGLMGWIDVDYWNRVAHLGKVRYMNETLAAFRISKRGQSSKLINEQKKYLREADVIAKRAYNLLQCKESIVEKALRKTMTIGKYCAKKAIFAIKV